MAGQESGLTLEELESLNQEQKLGPVGIWSEEPAIRNSKFFAECLNRLVTGRDVNVIITASSETGVGKTTLAVTLSLMLDQHGWTADKAAVADADEYDRLYDQVDPGSALILDEAEKAADARRGMSSSSVELSQTFATKRYRQVFSILTAPSKNWIDKRLGSDAADYWLQALETDRGRIKGEAKCYRLRTNEHYEQEYVERTEFISFPNLDDLPEFDRLDQRKVDLLEHKGDGEQKYLEQSEVDAIVSDAKEEAAKSKRDEIVTTLSRDTELTQKEIGELIGMSAGNVNRIVNK